MTETQWNAFYTFKEEFKELCIRGLEDFGYRYSPPETAASATSLRKKNAALFDGAALDILQEQAALADKVPPYLVETPIVYNHNLDFVQKDDCIKIILVGDNPGKNEQRHSNQRYLVGQAGKVADGFFSRNPELGIDFRKNIIILNKTPLHTAKTAELQKLLDCDSRDKKIRNFLEKTQVWLAEQAAFLQQALDCQLWLVGYGQLRKKSLFTVYAERLIQIYEKRPKNEQRLGVYQHFSMNCFLNNLNKNRDSSLSLAENLYELGLKNRKEILGF
ncbi:hypothetical protein [Treponema phagedenis]|uniref:hypothetical protein n=1 Tax=Treponema phagedenis TaxID=162 RepID=UPI0015819472|nr:hypothetical protein [Treponema phagedenis]NVP23923.1 hypothetical protein [Treponema phagedenis]QKS91204.1 hypothetical protein HPJ96_00460 [Treponema phagedenis]QLC59461.1 hypothetical protein HW453_12115 [Treponema phagedenis]